MTLTPKDRRLTPRDKRVTGKPVPAAWFLSDRLVWQDVTSSNIRRVAYQADTNELQRGVLCGWLFVQFQDGRVHAYKDVPAVVFTHMQEESISAGRFFHRCVKDRYDSVKIEAEQ